MPKIDRQKLKRVVIVALLGAIVVVLLIFTEILVRYPEARGPGIGQTLEVEIDKGCGPSELSKLLEEKGIIDTPYRFNLWLRVTRKYPLVKAGKFQIKDDLSPQEILKTISGRGMDKGVRVTIPEGFTLVDIARVIESANLGSFDEFLACTEGPLVKRLKVPAHNFEGFLFPDTYFFKKGMSSEEMVTIMHRHFLKKTESIKRDNFPLLETVTLASIVQAEAAVESEMPTIAAVYKNRLDEEIFPSQLMQADPTVAYGCNEIVESRAPSCKGFSGKLTRKQLDDPLNLYNTYKHKGLPKGPICSPGLGALKAAAAPEKTEFLYFVAGPNGEHRFAKTFEEHNRNVALCRQGN